MNQTPDGISPVQRLEDGLAVGLHGDVDYSRSPEVRQQLLALLEQKPSRLVVDLTGVPYMDSSGVATLVEALQVQRRRGGKLVLCGLQPKVRGIFDIARLSTVFAITDDLEAAKLV
jgi:anti-sigma B factor antagonist